MDIVKQDRAAKRYVLQVGLRGGSKATSKLAVLTDQQSGTVLDP